MFFSPGVGVFFKSMLFHKASTEHQKCSSASLLRGDLSHVATSPLHCTNMQAHACLRVLQCTVYIDCVLNARLCVSVDGEGAHSLTTFWLLAQDKDYKESTVG